MNKKVLRYSETFLNYQNIGSCLLRVNITLHSIWFQAPSTNRAGALRLWLMFLYYSTLCCVICTAHDGSSRH